MKLTKPQADIVSWALDAMTDYAVDPDCDYEPEDLPTLEGGELSLGSSSSTHDLLFRLEIQIVDMGMDLDDDDTAQWRGNVRAAKAVASKIHEGGHTFNPEDATK